MIVMVSNQTGWKVHYWQGKYGGLGHLYSPGGHRGPFPHIPYALDNGAYEAYKNGTPWDEGRFIAHLERYEDSMIDPCWVVAPDVVGDGAATLEAFPGWRARLEERGHTVALAVQDGMKEEDVRALSPDVVFVGGSVKWKWRTLHWWLRFKRVHVARVNRPKALWHLLRSGVESIDGTCWFGGNPEQTRGLEEFLRLRSEGKQPEQLELL